MQKLITKIELLKDENPDWLDNYCKDKENYKKCNKFQYKFAIDNPDHELKDYLDDELSKMNKKIEKIEKLFETIEVTIGRMSERLDKLEEKANLGINPEDNL